MRKTHGIKKEILKKISKCKLSLGGFLKIRSKVDCSYRREAKKPGKQAEYRNISDLVRRKVLSGLQNKPSRTGLVHPSEKPKLDRKGTFLRISSVRHDCHERSSNPSRRGGKNPLYSVLKGNTGEGAHSFGKHVV